MLGPVRSCNEMQFVKVNKFDYAPFKTTFARLAPRSAASSLVANRPQLPHTYTYTETTNRFAGFTIYIDSSIVEYASLVAVATAMLVFS